MTPEEYNAQQEYLLTHPQTITKLQAMKQLKVLKLWSKFQNILANNADANDVWLLALNLDRKDPLVANIGKSLNLTDTDIDNLFAEASKL